MTEKRSKAMLFIVSLCYQFGAQCAKGNVAPKLSSFYQQCNFCLWSPFSGTRQIIAANVSSQRQRQEFQRDGWELTNSSVREQRKIPASPHHQKFFDIWETRTKMHRLYATEKNGDETAEPVDLDLEKAVDLLTPQQPPGQDISSVTVESNAESPALRNAEKNNVEELNGDEGEKVASTELSVSLEDEGVNEDRDLSFFGIPVQSVVLLNAVAVIWGTQHSVIKMVVADESMTTGDAMMDASTMASSSSSPAAFTLARFAIAALVASPFTPSLKGILQPGVNKANVIDRVDDTKGSTGPIKNKRKGDNILAWRWGLEMGLWMFLGYAFQAVGLEYTTATKSGFILYLNVKFVPFLARIVFGRRISIPTWISAATALTGTAMLTIGDDIANHRGTDGDLATLLQSFNVGDAWSIAAALASALFILRLESASNEVKEPSALNAASLWVVTSLSFLWTILAATSDNTSSNAGMATDIVDVLIGILNSVGSTIREHGWELIYLGAITTALANYLQTIGQRGITAERASVIYAMDPVYGALFAHWILGEELGGVWGYIGATLITLAAATNAFLDFGAPKATTIKEAADFGKEETP